MIYRLKVGKLYAGRVRCELVSEASKARLFTNMSNVKNHILHARSGSNYNRSSRKAYNREALTLVKCEIVELEAEELDV